MYQNKITDLIKNRNRNFIKALEIWRAKFIRHLLRQNEFMINILEGEVFGRVVEEGQSSLEDIQCFMLICKNNCRGLRFRETDVRIETKSTLLKIKFSNSKS